jgi:hypothetical protein
MKRILVVIAMLAAINCSMLAESVQNAPNLELVDVPTENVLLKGMYDINLKFYASGGIEPTLRVGIANMLMLGVDCSMNNLIGTGTITADTPNVIAKFKITEDSPAFPAIAVGWDPIRWDQQSYSLSTTMITNNLRPLGLYAVATKQMVSNIYLDFGVCNHNVFSGFNFSNDFGAFVGGLAMLNNDFGVMLEYNDLTSTVTNSLNLGFRYAVAPELRLELDLKDLLGNGANVERDIKIDYVNYF